MTIEVTLQPNNSEPKRTQTFNRVKPAITFLTKVMVACHIEDKHLVISVGSTANQDGFSRVWATPNETLGIHTYKD